MRVKGKDKAIKIGSRKGKDAVSSAEATVNEYRQRLYDVGRPLSCTVSVINSRPSGEFTMLEVQDVKQTVSFPYENGGIGYKTLTHVLSNGIAAYGLACASDGTVEAYVLDDDSTISYDTEFVGEKRVRRHVVDPMFAFSSPDGVYVIFNDPTTMAIDSGAKARKPVYFPDENMVLASGAPVAVKFTFGEGFGKFLLPTMEPMSRYVAGILDDPKSDFPLLLVANILSHSEEEEKEDEDSRPSFGKMIEDLFEDDMPEIKKASEFPIGISVARLADKEPKFEQVPMAGNMDYGIKEISIGESEDGENNAVDIKAVL